MPLYTSIFTTPQPEITQTPTHSTIRTEPPRIRETRENAEQVRQANRQPRITRRACRQLDFSNEIVLQPEVTQTPTHSTTRTEPPCIRETRESAEQVRQASRQPRITGRAFRQLDFSNEIVPEVVLYQQDPVMSQTDQFGDLLNFYLLELMNVIGEKPETIALEQYQFLYQLAVGKASTALPEEIEQATQAMSSMKFGQ
jgi:hypothetical protein